MRRKQQTKLPRARIAHRRNVLIEACLSRFGRNELAAVSLAGCILLTMGLLLAGFGSLNAQDLSTAYPTQADADDSESEERPTSACSYVDAQRESCEDTWARAMAGASDDLWNGEDDWVESQCKRADECVEASPPPIANSEWGNPRPNSNILPEYWDDLWCGNDRRLKLSPEELRRDQARFYAAAKARLIRNGHD